MLLLFEGVIALEFSGARAIKSASSVTKLEPERKLMNYIVPAPTDYSYDQALEVLTQREDTDETYKFIVNDKEAYPQRLLINLANNPELISFVADYQDKSEEAAAITSGDMKLTKTERESNCPLFLQWDPRWGYCAYGDDNLASSGCGPTALSMVVVGLTHDEKATPLQIAEFATAQGYYVPEVGTGWNLMTEGAAHYGLTSDQISITEEGMKETLDQGGLLICSVKAGDFTTGGHFIVVCGYGDKGFVVNDPFCIYRSEQNWKYDTLASQMVAMWAVKK